MSRSRSNSEGKMVLNAESTESSLQIEVEAADGIPIVLDSSESDQMLAPEEVALMKVPLDDFFAYIADILTKLNETIVENPLSFDDVSYKIAIAKTESVRRELEQHQAEVSVEFEGKEANILAAKKALEEQKANLEQEIKYRRGRIVQFQRDFAALRSQLSEIQLVSSEAGFKAQVGQLNTEIDSANANVKSIEEKLQENTATLQALATRTAEVATIFQEGLQVCASTKVALDDAKAMTTKFKLAEQEAKEKADYEKSEQLRQGLVDAWKAILEDYQTTRNEKYATTDKIKKGFAKVGNLFGEDRYTPGKPRQQYITDLKASLDQYARVGSLNNQFELTATLLKGITLFKPRKDKEQSLQSCLKQIESGLNPKKI